MLRKISPSLWTVILSFGLIVGVKYATMNHNQIAWDAFGYYLYLPATFIHGDLWLDNIQWINDLMAENPNMTGTLYQVCPDAHGGKMYLFLGGMSAFYSPSFFVGHGIASLSDQYPANGVSLPYQYALAFGTLLYVLIGLIYLRKILLRFASEKVVVITMIVIVIGTNYLHFMGIKNLATANVLFMLLTMIVWNTIRWHEDHRLRNMLGIAAGIALITWVKPSEILCGLVPLVWGVYNKETLIAKARLLGREWKQLALAIVAGLAILSPQLIYWKIESGQFIFDSYQNPGIGLDFFEPHIFEVLFSYRKGWLLYTPIMVFALLGFYQLYKQKREQFWAISIYFLASFWLIASWTEWWYGAGFSNRPVVTLYVVLSIPLALFIRRLLEGGKVRRYSLVSLGVLFIGLNLFQMWQIQNYILDPVYTSKDYYWASFGQTSVPEGASKLKLIQHSYFNDFNFDDPENYKQKNIGCYRYDDSILDSDPYLGADSTGNMYYTLDSTKHFSQSVHVTYESITSKDHAWIRASAKVMLPEGYDDQAPFLVCTMERKDGLYHYQTVTFDPDTVPRNEWVELTLEYLTPEIRSERDFLLSYVWHPAKERLYVDDFCVDAYDRK